MARITLENVSVNFMLVGGAKEGLIESLRQITVGGAVSQANGKVDIAAIQNVNLDLEDGDRIALIGHNGAGKTTLLKVMAGILPPTQGRVRIEGRVSPLLSIHLGLNQEISGVDNITARARLMGHSEKEIDARRDEIAEFSDLGDYLHLPIKSYSSGMRVRLAFAISTAFEPDILILDEWLSAGDDAFRQKATDRLNNLIDRTGIVVFASHNKALQQRVCNKGMLLENGKVVYIGDIDEAFKRKAERAAKTA